MMMTIVYGFEEDDHDINATLNDLLKRAKKKILIQPWQTELWTSEIPFFRHIISKEGIKPNHKKVNVITYINPLEDKSN